MSRISNSLAHRIDRMAWRAHAFHRYAHHPLCAAYRGETLRLGKVWVCKGCTFVGLGGGLGALAGFLAPRLPLQILFLGFMIGIGKTLILVAIPRVRTLGKGITRLLPGLCCSFLVIQGLRHAGFAGWLLVGLVLIGVGLAVVRYRLRGPWRGPCLACPELGNRPCSGFRLQLRRERAFQRMAGRMVAATSLGLPGQVDKMDPPSM